MDLESSAGDRHFGQEAKIPIRSGERKTVIARKRLAARLVRTWVIPAVACLASASGAIRTVTNLNDSGAGSLRDTIAAAAAGDTIQFGVTGTITLTSDQLTVNKNLTITGPGPGSLAITFGGFGRAFWIPSGTVNISGMTILNCNENYGSALLIQAGTTVSLTNCLIQANQTHHDFNSIYPFPGAIQNLGALTLTDCTFLGNTGTFGGSHTVKCEPGGSLTVLRCTFQATIDAIRCEGPLTLTNSTFYESRAIAATGGGSISSCTICKSWYDGIFVAGSPLTIRNTIIADTDTVGGESYNIYIGKDGSVNSQGYNLSDDDGGGWFTGPGDQINVDPKLDLQGLVYNGGYTGTIALRSGSPAIDKGKAFGLTTDQRGQPRTIDNPEAGPAPGGDGTDIGAYEAPADALQPEQDLVVNTLADHDDGTCGVTDCTLREAVTRANFASNNAGTVDISFAPGLTGTLTLNNALGTLTTNKSFRITGPGARVLALSGGGNMRILNVSSASLFVTGLTLQQGWQASGNLGASNQGGAIFNQAGLVLEDCAFFGNYAAGVSAGSSGSGGAGRGGAIYNSAGNLTMRRCLFASGGSSGNVAGGGSGASSIVSGSTGGAGGAAQGGAVYNAAGAHLFVENCTFHGNSVSSGSGGNGGSGGRGGSGGLAGGGAIYNQGELTLTGCTVSGNVATGGAGGSTRNNTGDDGRAGNAIGGILSAAGASTTVKDTICAANTAGGPGAVSHDVQGTFVSSGFNLIGTADDSTGFNQASDQTGTDAAPVNPGLGPLADNGGPTNTLSPLANSTARDRGDRFNLTTDQRSVARPVNDPAVPDAAGGDGSDIGAVEFLSNEPQPGPTFVVTTLADHDDGVCSYLDGTLREAINAANTAAGPNTIIFAPTLGGTITLGSALPDITGDLKVISDRGPVFILVSGAHTYRVFNFTGGNNEVSGLTIQDGTVLGFVLASAGGGGISNQATLKLTDCVLKGNLAQGGSAITTGSGGSGRGGGIFNSGTLTLERCTIQDSVAQGGSGSSSASGAGRSGGSGSGGAIFNDLAGVLTLVDCTVAQNSGNGGNGGNGSTSGGNGGAGQGGIFNQGSLTVTACTFSLNNGRGGTGGSGTTPGTGGSASGGLYQAAGTGSTTVTNSIVAGNLASGNSPPPDIAGAFLSTGHNLIGNGTAGSGFNQQGDQVGGISGPAINARLGTLKRQLGWLPVMAIGLNSPAFDKGRSAGLIWDQRGMPRRVDAIVSVNAAGGDGTDIGAFEYNPFLYDSAVANSETHSDNDGMPDEYEIFHGLNPYDAADGAYDTDGDGMTNLDEWQAGTNPRDPASVLRVLEVDHLGNSVRIRFGQAVPGFPYWLEYKSNLSDPTWQQIPGADSFSALRAGEGELIDPTVGGIPRRFYHVRFGF